MPNNCCDGHGVSSLGHIHKKKQVEPHSFIPIYHLLYTALGGAEGTILTLTPNKAQNLSKQ